LEVLGDSVILHDTSGQDRLIFINAFVNKEDGGSGGGSGGGKDSKGKSNSFFSSELLTYMLFPASLGAVYYW